MKLALIHSDHTSLLSYQNDWLDSLSEIDTFTKSYNLINMNIYKFHRVLKDFDYVIFLHSTNSNGFKFSRLLKVFSNYLLLYRKAKVIFFVGNEYKLMPEKIDFIAKNKVDIVVSQYPLETAKWLYEKTDAKIISLPHALNLKHFYPKVDLSKRKIDIGNRSYEYPKYLGDNLRLRTYELMKNLRNEFVVDVSSDPNKRFNRNQWSEFLNNCKYTISSEVGSKYVERDDYTRKIINEFELKGEYSKIKKYFQDYKPLTYLSGKAIGGRHFDAVGTKTCQILVEGEYSNILKPNKHYIELKKDFSNLYEVKQIIKSDSMRKFLVEEAFDHIKHNHLYKHRIEKLLKNI